MLLSYTVVFKYYFNIHLIFTLHKLELKGRLYIYYLYIYYMINVGNNNIFYNQNPLATFY